MKTVALCLLWPWRSFTWWCREAQPKLEGYKFMTESLLKLGTWSLKDVDIYQAGRGLNDRCCRVASTKAKHTSATCDMRQDSVGELIRIHHCWDTSMLNKNSIFIKLAPWILATVAWLLFLSILWVMCTVGGAWRASNDVLIYATLLPRNCLYTTNASSNRFWKKRNAFWIIFHLFSLQYPFLRYSTHLQ